VKYLLALIIIAGMAFWLVKQPLSLSLSSPTAVTPITTTAVTPVLGEEQTNDEMVLEKMDRLSFRGGSYSFLSVSSDAEKVRLLPNFNGKASAAKLAADGNCLLLINGGFYSEDGKPLGWFVSENKPTGGAITSSLFDAFIYQDKNLKVIIDNKPVSKEVEWGLQTGPALVWDKQPITLSIRNDKPARRMVIALSDRGEIYFWVFTKADSLASGPLLGDLPEIIQAAAKAKKITLDRAVNLDGGLASAFISPDIRIPEFSWIGSYFCEQ
jgi:uncharacterized protein YigE (DUF2233 family)